MKPALSVVIPTYNEEGYLPLLLSALADQTFTDFEVIVADNFSTDATADIALGYRARVVPGGKPGAGRNSGALHANADLLLFLDADVVPSRRFIEQLLQEFNSRGLDLATCNTKPLSDNRFDVAVHGLYNQFIRSTAGFAPHAPGFCILVKTCVHDAVGGFDESIVLAEDTDYVSRAGLKYCFGVLQSEPIHVSVRRLERDGRLNVVGKMVLCGMYTKVFGPIRSNLFNYTFGHSGNRIDP